MTSVTLSQLNGAVYTESKLRYPLSEKDRSASRMQFEIIKTIPPSFSLNFQSIFNWKEEQRIDTPDAVAAVKLDTFATGKKVDLYIPQAHTITEAFGYQTPDLGIAGGAGLQSMEQGGNVTDAAKAAINQGFQGISNLIQAFNGTDLGRLGIVRGAAAAPISNNIRSAISVTARTSLHPNTRAVFERPQIRKFTFQFKFIPVSTEESSQVKQIIDYFRFHSYPKEIVASSVGSDFSVPVGYEFPDMFRIKLYTKVDGRYKRIGVNLLDCYCEGITTNFNPQAAVFHPDGSPVEIDLTLNFMEHRALSRDDIQGSEYSATERLMNDLGY